MRDLTLQFPELEGTPFESAAFDERKCGPYAAYLTLRRLGVKEEGLLEQVQGLCRWDRSSGTTLGGLQAALQRFGVESEVARLSVDELALQSTPSILLMTDSRYGLGSEPSEDGGGHLIVYAAKDEDGFLVLDPPGVRTLTREQLERDWTGVGLCVPSRTVPQVPPSPVSLSIGAVVGLILAMLAWRRRV